MDVKLFNQPSDQLDEELLREGPDLRVPRCRQGEDVLDGLRRHCFLIFLEGEGKTTYTFSVSVNAFSVEFPLACYQQAGKVWYVSGALRRT
jgi:hypothetical protein